MTETETKMTTDEFWATVAEMGWGTKTTDTKKLKRFLMRKGKEFCKEFERVYSTAVTAWVIAAITSSGWARPSTTR
jgi:hypothetical protein